MKKNYLFLLGLLLLGIIINNACTKDPETVIVEYFNKIIITNNSVEAANNSEATFSIWANGNIGGEIVKDGDYFIPKGGSISIDISYSLPEGEEPSLLFSPEGPEGCWQNCDYKSALTSYPSSNPEIESGDQLSCNMTSDQIGFNSSGGGSGTDCSEWYPFYDCGGNPAYMQIKICKVSETSTTVTLAVDLQPNNGGLVGSSDNIMQIFYGDNTHEMTYADFNANGFAISSTTVDKTFVYLGDTYTWDDEKNAFVNQTTGAVKVTGIVTVWC